MKKLIALGIDYIKRYFTKHATDVVTDTVKEKVEGLVTIAKHEGLEEARKKANEAIEKVTASVTSSVGDAVGTKLKEASEGIVGSITKAATHVAAKPVQTTPDVTDRGESTKVYLDVKLNDLYDKKERDCQLVVTHFIETRKLNDTVYQAVVIENVEERERSKRNHNADRNLLNKEDSNFVETLKLYYEQKGIQLLEVFHVPLPRTTLQDI